MLHYFSKAVLPSQVWGAAPPPSLRKGQFSPPLACVWVPSDLQSFGFTLALVLLAAPFPGAPSSGTGHTRTAALGTTAPAHCSSTPTPHPQPFVLEHIRERREWKTAFTLIAHKIKPRCQLWRCKNGDFLSCHEFMPAPSPPPGKEEQEGCYQSQRGTFSVDPLSSLGRPREAPPAVRGQWGRPKLITGFAGY